MFLSFFFKQYKRTKTVKIAANARRKRGHTAGDGAVQAQSTSHPNLVNETVVSPGEHLDAEEEELAKLVEGDQDEEKDEDGGQDAHDKEVVSSVRKKAIDDMMAKGVFILSEDKQTALGIFPKASRLSLFKSPIYR